MLAAARAQSWKMLRHYPFKACRNWAMGWRSSRPPFDLRCARTLTG